MFITPSVPTNPAITMAINNYFNGYLKAEPETLAKGFYSEARLFSTENTNLERTEMSDWLKSLHERQAKGDVRQADVQILGIDFTGDAAIAKTRLIFPKFSFTDYLSLLCIGGNWLIVNKIYSMQDNVRAQ